jgi:hypothetical protein
MLSTFLSILTLVAMLAAGYGVGRPIVRVLMKREEVELSAVIVWSLLVGWVVIGLVIAMLGMTGLLHRAVVGVGTFVAVFLGAGEVARAFGARSHRDQGVPSVIREMLRFREPVEAPSQIPTPSPWLLRFLGTLATIAVVASFFGALAPPTAGDALNYHLELPKRFIAAGSLTYLPYSDQSTFPLLVQMWYLWAMILHSATAIQGAVAAQLVHWMCGVMLGLAALTLARPILGQRWSAIVASVVYITPGMTNQMTAPMNDVALAMMTTLALAAWWRFAINREGRGWCILAGIAAGGALGTKYIAALFAIAAAISWLGIWLHQKDRRLELLKGTLLVGGMVILVSGVWYARACHYRGNPVYPFFAKAHHFGGDSTPAGVQHAYLSEKDKTAAPELPHLLAKKTTKKPSVQLVTNNSGKTNREEKSADKTAFETLPKSKSPMGRSLVALITAPWHVTIDPDRFGGRSHQLGVLFLAGLPGLLFVRRLRGLGTLLATAAAYFVLWFFLRQNVRFLFPIVPLLAVGLVWVWIEMARMPKTPRTLAMAVFLFALTVYAGVSVRRSWDRVPVALGVESQEDYLFRSSPHYVVAKKINQRVGPAGHLLSQDFRNFYLTCAVTSEGVFHRFISYETSAVPEGHFTEMLREAGFSHVLLIRNLNSEGDQTDTSLFRRLQSEGDVSLEVLQTIDDPDGGRRQYLLGRLTKPLLSHCKVKVNDRIP